MNKVVYDQQKLRAFLLGALPEDETEAYDELSFTDDSFADELNAAEKDLIDAYARGELGGAALESFETHYLASPLRREKVEFARAFQTFAETKFIDQSSETAAAAPEEKRSRLAGFFAGLNIFGNLRTALQFGLAAATVLLFVLGGWLWTENRRLNEQASETERKRNEILRREQEELRRQIQTGETEKAEAEKELARLREERGRLEERLNQEKSQKERIVAEQKKRPEPPPIAPKRPAAPVSIASFILAPPLRSGSQIPNLSIPAKTDFVAAQLQLETGDFAQYRVALVDQAGRTLWQSGRTKARPAAAGQIVSVRFPAKILKSGVYSLVVSGIGTAGAAEEIAGYPVRVVLN